MRVAAACGAVAMAGCDSNLPVSNTNVVDVSAAFQTADGAAQVAGKSFQGMFVGQYNTLNSIWPQTLNFGLESGASVNNAGMNVRMGLPRDILDNSLGSANLTLQGNNQDFSVLTRFARQSADAVKALDKLSDTPLAKARTRAIGYLNIGYALGQLSMIYDSASVITPSATDEANFAPASVVNATALAMLDSAIAVGTDNTTNVSPAFPIPGASYINGTSLDAQTFVRMARSLKARFRAGVARTPAARAAVNWTEVLADATNGITSNITVTLDPTLGWSVNGTIVQLTLYQGWHYMPTPIIGMADTSGAYNAYITSGALASRNGYILIKTPDKRFPSGETRVLQNAQNTQEAPSATLYFRNRPAGEDGTSANARDGWSNSFYDHTRFRAIRNASGSGTWVLMESDEIGMLAAEALLQLNRPAEAIPLINDSRARNGLVAIPLTNGVNDPVPGGSGCVPRVPVAGGTATACGSTFEAMKWEKRMETAFTGYSQWYIDSRGWGDLIVGTPLEWAVPIQELNSRLKPQYQNTNRAAVGTYGF
ncbi:MAG: RagB/SusD family nutrient uptake outer membrane protein [Gemmatimonadaceae bacterium]|nr:RagB/SusD family nutrient uptake outer membrane protein [Gemmatimonadaceae bacterium]